MDIFRSTFPFLDGLSDKEFLTLFLLLMAWEMAWKGLALWRSARRQQMNWFVALLVVNSAGVLPIIYLLLNKDSVKR